MSCTTQNQQPIRFVVSMGSLPEGFCGTPQQLAQAIADRLIIQADPFTSSFATGSIAPTSNVGPWLKNCEEWWIWDDAISAYKPMPKQGFNQEMMISTSQNFIVPDNIYYVRASIWGGGGGGNDGVGGSNGGGGAGGGAFCRKILPVTPGQAIAVVIGAGGLAGLPGSDGGNTTFLTLTAGGGKASVGNAPGGQGGIATGGTINFSGGGGSNGFLADPGHGGDSPQGGSGGMPNDVSDPLITNGQFPGGGGTGGYPAALPSGNGASGAAFIEW